MIFFIFKYNIADQAVVAIKCKSLSAEYLLALAKQLGSRSSMTEDWIGKKLIHTVFVGIATKSNLSKQK